MHCSGSEKKANNLFLLRWGMWSILMLSRDVGRSTVDDHSNRQIHDAMMEMMKVTVSARVRMYLRCLLHGDCRLRNESRLVQVLGIEEDEVLKRVSDNMTMTMMNASNWTTPSCRDTCWLAREKYWIVAWMHIRMRKSSGGRCTILLPAKDHSLLFSFLRRTVYGKFLVTLWLQWTISIIIGGIYSCRTYRSMYFVIRIVA
jgi:hypothetical protein